MDIGRLIFLSIFIKCMALNCFGEQKAIKSLNCCMQTMLTAKQYLFTCYRHPTNDSVIDTRFTVYFEALVHMVNSRETRIKVRCSAEIPNIHNILVYLEVNDVVSVNYQECPVGKEDRIVKSFGENAAKLERIEVSSGVVVGNTSMQPDIFEGLETIIQELHIKNMQHTSATLLSDNFFDKFTSLKTLVLCDNNLQSTPRSISVLKSLSELDLKSNSIRELNRSTFRGLTSLTDLHLNENPIEIIHEGAFSDLRSLKNLDLTSATSLRELPDNVFSGLHSLETLSFGSCHNLRTLTSSKLLGMPSLKTLALNGASMIGRLPEDLFVNVPRLENVILRSCRLTSVPPKLFASNSNLSIVDLSDNQLTEIPKELFATNCKLISIDLSWNDISSVEGVFIGLYRLRTLNLERNNLFNLSSTVFESLSGLIHLHLANSEIRHIDDQTFFNLINLRTLNLNNNYLERFGGIEPMFQNWSALERLLLSNNALTSFPQIDFKRLPSLNYIELNHNLLTHFVVEHYQGSAREIQLMENKITTVDIEAVSKYEIMSSKTHSFQLYGNPFRCDCKLYEFVKYIRGKMDLGIGFFSDAERYVCSDSKVRLMSVDLSKLSCESPCSDGCRCCERPHDSSTHASCYNQNMTNIPALPGNVTHVDFRGNYLTDYPEALNNYPQLEEVLLDDNHITSIESALNYHKSLKLLSVTGNRLETIKFKNNITFRLRLANNPWRCDCSTLSFKRFVSSNADKIIDYSSIHCKNSFMIDGVETTLLKDIPEKLYCDPGHDFYLYIVAGISTAFLVTLVLIALYYRNRHLVTAYTFIHFNYLFVCLFSNSDRDEARKYDAFIAYSSNDRQIAMDILKELEKPVDGRQQFRLCVHERDFIPGFDIMKNITDSIKGSRRTILILTREFVESVWFEMEFRTAYLRMKEDRTNSLIIVIKDDLPPKDSMNSELRSVLSTKTYLKWGEKWFWEKLRYAMPHKRQRSRQNSREVVDIIEHL